MNCRGCSKLVPPHARHCPKCGKPVPEVRYPIEPRMAVGAVPAKGPLPRSGKLFLLALAIGSVLAALGVWEQYWPLCWIGAGVVALVFVVLIVGDLIGI